MTLPLAFHPDVHADVDEAFRWHEKQRAGLGDDLLAAIEEVYARIQENPCIHQVIHGSVRRGLMRRFPYGAYYRAHKDRVEIVAIYHSKRDPAGWQARTMD